MNNELIITVPSFLSTDEAIKEITKLIPQLVKFKTKSANKPNIIFVIGDVIELPHFSIHLTNHDLNSNLLIYKKEEKQLHFCFSRSAEITTDNVQKSIKHSIDNVCKQLAYTFIPNRIKELATMHDFKYANVKINNSKGRWGSCSSLGNINISLSCMMLPLHLLDLVLLHELCHTIEMNHSKAFWSLLDKVTNGNCKELTIELKSVKLPW